MTQATASSIRPEWGHPLICPDGREIRVPSFVFGKLRKLGLLDDNKGRLSPMAYEFMAPQYDCICDGLRQILGEDLSGPKWIVCGCRKCKEGMPYREPDLGEKVATETIKNRRD